MPCVVRSGCSFATVDESGNNPHAHTCIMDDAFWLEFLAEVRCVQEPAVLHWQGEEASRIEPSAQGGEGGA